MADEVKLTLAERLEIARIEARGVRRAFAGIEHQPGIDRAIERVREKARKRAAKGK